MRFNARVITAVFLVSLCNPLHANTFGSVEPIANPAVIDTAPLRDQSLEVRAAFAARLLQCGVVSQVVEALTSTGAITTINDLNTSFAVGAGGFAGHTNPAYVYTVIDDGPNAASLADVKILTDSLGYVLSQGSAFLLDADNSSSFDFPANYVVLNFPAPPPLSTSAAQFETVSDELWQEDLDLRAVRDGHQRLHAVRPGLSVAAIRRTRRTIHRGVCQGGGNIRRRVHTDRRRQSLAIHRRRRFSRKRLDREPGRGGVPRANPVGKPQSAGAYPSVPPARHA